ncbi:hypothetical protein GY45DRAFT_1320241 [Cubamyces sp. BRFM 1775]|nr:hypothetical protein GY45DRAFT_1320241 [Cubamyces sp. BRFM 1775]
MYARAIHALTLLFATSLALVSASPAPIDPQQANVIAENHNAACSGPAGCVGANGTLEDASSTSGAALSLSLTSGALTFSVAAAGSLSMLAGIL